jgi:hypothetical protein
MQGSRGSVSVAKYRICNAAMSSLNVQAEIQLELFCADR